MYPRSFTLPFNFAQVLLWSKVIKLYSLNSAGYYFALLRFLLHLGIQLWGQTSFDLISNCLFSATWTWICHFCGEQKEHQWINKEFSFFILLMPSDTNYGLDSTSVKIGLHMRCETLLNLKCATTLESWHFIMFWPANWTPLLWGNKAVITPWKIIPPCFLFCFWSTT